MVDHPCVSKPPLLTIPPHLVEQVLHPGFLMDADFIRLNQRRVCELIAHDLCGKDISMINKYEVDGGVFVAADGILFLIVNQAKDVEDADRHVRKRMSAFPFARKKRLFSLRWESAPNDLFEQFLVKFEQLGGNINVIEGE